MHETINLIPQEERVQQTKTKVVKMSTILAIVLLIIVGGVGGFFYYRSYTLKQQIKSVDEEITNYRAQITKLQPIEIVARNLYKKTTTLEQIFKSRIYYSKLISNVNESTPGSVVVDAFGMGKENSISLSGKADDYRSIQEFMDKLKEREIFTEVAINSANLENRLNKTAFLLVVTYNAELLYE